MSDDMVTIIQEMIAEDMLVLQSLFETDFVPLIKHRRELERKAFDKAYKEVRDLERGV